VEKRLLNGFSSSSGHIAYENRSRNSATKYSELNQFKGLYGLWGTYYFVDHSGSGPMFDGPIRVRLKALTCPKQSVC